MSVPKHVQRAIDERTVCSGSRTMDVVNANRSLRRFLRANDTYRRYLPTETWLSGGCWLLAEALRQVLGGELVAVTSGHGVEHVALQFKGWIIDGDGFSQERALIRRWRQVEGVRGAQLVPLRSVLSIVIDIPPPDQRLAPLVHDLRRVFEVT